MDPKAAAKSKRTHTVHGRRNHPTPSASAAHKQKRTTTTSSPAAAGGGGGGGGRGRKLPSNWDRYDAEAAEAAETAAWPGEVAPKSQGADFGFLLEQARSQPREARGLGMPWLASEDSPIDFMQGSTSMLSAKSEGILSWSQDDNFIIDDDSMPNFEVPFLSMDLHALARQLSKLKLSQRLFIEEDLLPEDLADGFGDNQISNQPDTSMASEVKDSLVQPEILSDVVSGKDVASLNYACELCFDDQVKQDLSLQDSQAQKSTMLHLNQDNSINTQLLEHSNTIEAKCSTVPGVTNSDPGRFEVSAAEAELDMLLYSFSETHLSSSNLDESFGTNSTFRSMKVSESNEKVTPASSSRTLAVTPLDDALDDLLSETPLSLQDQRDVASVPTSGDFSSTNLISCSFLNSDHNIDFISAKQIDITTPLDDSIADLLVESSLCLKDQKRSASPQEQGTIPSVNAPPRSSSSNAPDDFDSWFDSL